MKFFTKAKTAVVLQMVQNYHLLEKRYGRKQAMIIMAAAVAALPIPILGSSFIAAAPFLLAAEIYRRRKLHTGKKTNLSLSVGDNKPESST